MKIVSWNCGGKFREKWKEIVFLNADIYVIQECEDPELSNSEEYRKWAKNYFWLGKSKSKGLGVFAREGIGLSKLDWNSLCLSFSFR